jgi:hypothetical protein
MTWREYMTEYGNLAFGEVRLHRQFYQPTHRPLHDDDQVTLGGWTIIMDADMNETVRGDVKWARTLVGDLQRAIAYCEVHP